jgi:hypothetical protein
MKHTRRERKTRIRAKRERENEVFSARMRKIAQREGERLDAQGI